MPAEPPALRLRAAQAADARLVWTWASDAAVRRASFSPEAISWEDHQTWYAAKLADPRCRMFIGVDHAGVEAGVIRFDLVGDTYVVDVAIDAPRRGQGYGALIIALGVEHLRRDEPACPIRAEVKEWNQASQRAFRNAGFRLTDRIERAGEAVAVYDLPP